MFKEGESGNPLGRPKGSANKITAVVRPMIEKVITDYYSNEEGFKSDLSALRPAGRVRAYQELLSYVLTKPQPEAFDFRTATEEQLQFIIDGVVSMYESRETA